jgi:hypothetical protein
MLEYLACKHGPITTWIIHRQSGGIHRGILIYTQNFTTALAIMPISPPLAYSNYLDESPEPPEQM